MIIFYVIKTQKKNLLKNGSSMNTKSY
ncbi:hypothetical protein BpHYR1_030691 [Brachionus plicatilis]|uniref:Uncharacterized protein n=1 Tax=Brachionus plicatilis TaxID=10195 RepID=A0A3M7SAY8_BRAPC|nr:hypothetical protein BpHYR1_030691 [Brachionus plicatilis]